MKIFVKLACLILCVVIVGATLCGCQQLDDMRERTAVFTDNTKSSFTFRGYNYKKVDEPKDVYFILNNTEENYRITDKDVPILLSEAYGHTLLFEKTDDAPVVISAINVNIDTDSMSKDYMYIIRNGYYDSYESRFSYYIREDKIDEVEKLVEEAVVDRYYMDVYQYHDETREWLGGDYVDVLIDIDTTEAVNRTFKDGEKTKWATLNEKNAEWYSFQLYPCDENLLITNGKVYNVVTDTFDYYVYEDNNDGALYKASDNDFDLFKKLYKMNNDSVGIADVEWHVRYSDGGWIEE